MTSHRYTFLLSSPDTISACPTLSSWIPSLLPSPHAPPPPPFILYSCCRIGYSPIENSINTLIAPETMEYPCSGGVSTQPSAVFSSIHRKPRASEMTTTEARDAAVRAAKKHLREIVRDDWTYNPSSSGLPPQQPSSPPLSPAPTRDIQEWRERVLDTSCDEQDGYEKSSLALRSPSSARESYSPRPESPNTAERRLLERRSKRRKLLEDEMSWNNGLRIFIERRDAWSGAEVRNRRRPVSSRLESSKTTDHTDMSSDGQSGDGSRNSAEDVDMADQDSCFSSSLPRSLSAAADTSVTTAPDLQKHDSRTASGEMDGFAPLSPEAQLTDELLAQAQSEPLIPVVPPIIPFSNPVRASIDSSIYPSIYSKVVLQSLTPTVPINLSDMTKALVQGWKADGQWPPQGTAQDVVAIKRRAAIAQNAHASGIMGSSRAGNRNQANEAAAATARQKRAGSGVGETMRKVLGLPLHPFHIRRSSQPAEQGEQPPGIIRNN